MDSKIAIQCYVKTYNVSIYNVNFTVKTINISVYNLIKLVRLYDPLFSITAGSCSY